MTRSTRLSIIRLMGFVVLVALNCAAIAEFYSDVDDTLSLYLLGLLPVANVLLWGLPRTFPSSPPRTAKRCFWIGSEVFGWTAVIVFTILCRWDIQEVWFYLQICLAPVRPYFRRWGYNHLQTEWQLVEASLMSLALVLPQFVFALLGGLLNCFGWVLFVRRRSPARLRAVAGPRTVAASDSDRRAGRERESFPVED